MTGNIRIGTSGFHYKHWVGPFYPANTRPTGMLKYYQQQFNTVELNNTFYRLPKAEAFDAWRDATPDNFVFGVKASRFLTHNKKLKDPADSLHRFLSAATHLRHKLGPILFQLPPGWHLNLGRLEHFLSVLPRDLRYAFEFRDVSWMITAVTGLLSRFNAGFCIYELAGYHSPLHVTSDLVYVRLHGPESSKYQGSYSDQCLAGWARHVEGWAGQARDIFFYFDNDQGGYAARNGITLKRFVEGGA